MRLLVPALLATLLIPLTQAEAGSLDDWVKHSSKTFGIRFLIPAGADVVSGSWDDPKGKAWGYLHARNTQKAKANRCDLFVFAREGADLSNPERAKRFCKLFTGVLKDARWEKIYEKANHNCWRTQRHSDGKVIHLFVGTTANGAVILILEHPKGHALEHEDSYRYFYDNVETLQ